ncbi:MAG: MalY/PatB family protein [Pyramidobacter sp.]
MIYDFDRKIERRGTGNVKWDGLKGRFGTEDVLPLWIADMDFPAPEPVVKAIKERAAHPVYGYPRRDENYYDSFIDWEKRHNGWDVRREWCAATPGVVNGIAATLMGFTAPGDGVLIMPPCYHPFRNTVHAQGRRVVNSPMILRNGRFEVDFDDLAEKAKQCRLLLLCSPHNPTGRCFTRDELLKIEAICRANELLVVSDEIHSDLIFSGHRHIPFASLSDWAREHSITLMAPSKTFNVAGLTTSISVVPNAKLRGQMDHIVGGWMHVDGGNVFGIVAARAAYAEGEEWYLQMMKYLEGNRDYLDEQLKKRVPRVKLIVPEATYIPLIDCRELKFSPEELQQFMLFKVKAAMNEGTLFGEGGAGFCRINIGTQRAYLEEFVSRLERAVGELKLD